MKKNMIIVMPNMKIGGAERALINLLYQLPEDKFNVELLLLNHVGDLISLIPSHVKITNIRNYCNTYEEYFATHDDIKGFVKRFQIIKLTRSIFRTIQRKFMIKDKHKRIAYYNKYIGSFNSLLLDYDIALSYFSIIDLTTAIVAKKINAKVKIKWNHGDLIKSGRRELAFNYESYLKEFDHLIGVSKENTDQLQEIFPGFTNHISHIPISIPANIIKKLSTVDQGFQDNNYGKRILTVGRLEYVKGYDIAIRVMKKLKEQDYDLKWYVIGEGNEKGKLQKLIRKYGLEDDFILMGSKVNPYVYMRECDIYVQPSRFESFCITTTEAKILKKPIITANVLHAAEKFENGVTGLIIDLNEGNLYDAIVKLYHDDNLRKELTNNLKSVEPDCIDGSDKLIKLLN